MVKGKLRANGKMNFTANIGFEANFRPKDAGTFRRALCETDPVAFMVALLGQLFGKFGMN